MVLRWRLVGCGWRDHSSLLYGIGGLVLTRCHHGGGGRRRGAVNDPSTAPSLGAETTRQAATTDQSDESDEDEDPNDDPHKFQNPEDIPQL